MKPSYKTLEFYLSTIAMLMGVLMSSGILESTATNVDNQIVGLIVTVLSALGYTAARTVQKGNELKAAALEKVNPS